MILDMYDMIEISFVYITPTVENENNISGRMQLTVLVPLIN